MKKLFLFVSAVSALVSTHAHADGRIYLSNGGRHVEMTYQAPAVQSATEDELNDAINRLAANTQSGSRTYTTQNQYNAYPSQATSQASQYNQYSSNQYSNQSNSNNQSLGFSAPQNLSSSAAPSIAARLASNAAHGRSQGRCALYVRKALQSAGYEFTPQASAYMYANGTLQGAGFVKISANNYTPQVGDVVVFNRTGKHPHGHIQIYDGSGWVSDFRQPDFSPYSQHGGYTVWRDSKFHNAKEQGTYLALNDQ